MIIGVDLDAVLTDEHNWWLNNAGSYFAKRGKPLISTAAFSTVEMFGVTQEEADDYWLRQGNVWNYAQQVEPIGGASEFLKKIKQDGHTIIINTQRRLSALKNEDGERMRGIVLNWLKTYDMYYDDIAFSELGSDGKLKVMKEYKLDIHIDDSPKTIKLLSPHIPVIAFDMPYNQSVNLPNTHRAKNWEEVYKVIKELTL